LIEKLAITAIYSLKLRIKNFSLRTTLGVKNKITLASNNKAIFNFDRGYDDKNLISALVEN